jgi:hypothetical protein
MSDILKLRVIDDLKHNDVEDLFFRDAKGVIDFESEKIFIESYNWLVSEYNKKVYNLEEYEQRENSNKPYVAREKMFLLSLAKQLKMIRTEMELRKEAERLRADKLNKLEDQLQYWAIILELHGIDSKYFTGCGEQQKKFIVELYQLAKMSNSVRLPDAFIKNGNFQKTDFNLYSKT